VISISAVGSMKESIHPLDLVIPEQFYDNTKRRVSSFFGDGIVGHVGMADPVCSTLADALEKAARGGTTTVQRAGTYICIEGRSSRPRPSRASIGPGAWTSSA
jgi:5'-methylthioadenosine phosphorylase